MGTLYVELAVMSLSISSSTFVVTVLHRTGVFDDRASLSKQSEGDDSFDNCEGSGNGSDKVNDRSGSTTRCNDSVSNDDDDCSDEVDDRSVSVLCCDNDFDGDDHNGNGLGVPAAVAGFPSGNMSRQANTAEYGPQGI